MTNDPSPVANVLYVIATLDPAGAEQQLVALATRLDRSRFHPTVCCLTRGGPLAQDLAGAGVETIVLGKQSKLGLGVVPRLAGLIRRRHIDLVHTWLFTGNAFGRAAAVVAGGCKIVASERSVDRWRGWLHVLVDRALAARTSRIIANAEAVKQFYVESERIPARKFTVIPNGLDHARFSAVRPAALRQELGLAPDARLVGCAARLEEQKGIECLIDAARLLEGRDAHAVFLVAGDGPKAPELRARVRDVGLESHFRLLGHRDDMPSFMAGLDVFVLPSFWEGLPNVVLEAMAAGCAVVATNVGGTRELVEHGLTGLLVPARDPQAIADAVRRVLNDPVWARRLADAAREKAGSYTLERMVARTQQVYDEVLAG